MPEGEDSGSGDAVAGGDAGSGVVFVAQGAAEQADEQRRQAGHDGQGQALRDGVGHGVSLLAARASGLPTAFVQRVQAPRVAAGGRPFAESSTSPIAYQPFFLNRDSVMLAIVSVVRGGKY